MDEQVPTLRDALLSRRDWQQIADKQRSTMFAASVGAMSQARLEAFVQSLDLLDDSALAGLDSALQVIPHLRR